MHASSSVEHQNIEAMVLAAHNKKLNIDLVPKRLVLSEGTSVQLDGIDERRQVVCEVYARIGRLKDSQPDKVASDFLKLCLLKQLRGGGWRNLLCFACPEEAQIVLGKSWLSAAAKHFGVEIHVVSSPENERAQLLAAQAR